jgi:uncharacterized protein YgiM (DUF1202 family)
MCTLKKGFFVALTIFGLASIALAADVASPATPANPPAAAAADKPADTPPQPATPAKPAAPAVPVQPAAAPAQPATPSQPAAAPAAPTQPATPAQAPTPVVPPAVTETKPAEQAPQFPYIAEIVGTEVFVRSGPGTAYYHCGKLSAPQRVTVIGFTHNNWFQVTPPPGSFSWISKNYVKVDPANPKKGVVTGDAVRVWAGSDFVEPMRSSSMQTKLNKDAAVEIIGDPAGEGDYYKIAPPADAYLWVSGDCLKAFKKEGPKVETPAVTPAGGLKDVTEPVKAAQEAKKEPPKPVVPPRPSKEQEYLKVCRELTTKVEDENKKPVTEQKYDDYKKALAPILADPNSAGIAAQYAQLLSDIIKRYELAITAGAQVKQQEQKMADLRKQIDDAHKAQMEKISRKYEQYIMSGVLKPSYVYSSKAGQKRYLLMNEQNRVIAYIVLSDASMTADTEALLNTKVGVVGRIVNSSKELVTLVTATKVETLKE